MTEPHGPLRGVKVVACSTAQAGTVPYMLMADLGAEVIKIEVPQVGDNSRGSTVLPGMPSTYFETNNRGVKSVTVNLKTAEGVRTLSGERAYTWVDEVLPETVTQVGVTTAEVAVAQPTEGRRPVHGDAEPRLRRRRPRGLGEVLPLLRRRAANRAAPAGEVHDRPGRRRAAPR